MTESLTLKQLQKTVESLTPVLYYALSEFAERGQVYDCKATEWSTRFVIMHPDDFDQFSGSVHGVRLMPLKDEPKESIYERLMNRIGMIRNMPIPERDPNDNVINYHGRYA